ncbi:hypothetical protein HO173_012793 [Letharia columbiana]|uniref:Uncharacterized protein n=1 Tax=Letharia columbiana TaxID=112416 RepID=A0A8H6CL35_9LECA|nr:uncharacterized protein HO173_012793 [Letharia columbiana]KAF6225355.1 hypothetical protein HO173_012793 [Letharia columbiana]
MALQSFVTIAILFNWGLAVSAYPQAQDLGEAQKIYPRTVSGDVHQISVPTNSTTAPPLPPPPIGAIECFSSGVDRKATDVDGCRPTLNHFRTFPNYRLIQDFMEGRYPKLPSKPPYAIHQTQSTCAVQIASGDSYTIDDFSFEQARALATEILEVCQDHGGCGGFAPIGHGVGWKVVVIGFTLPPGPPDRTGLLEEVGSGNGTSMPVRIAEA